MVVTEWVASSEQQFIYYVCRQWKAPFTVRFPPERAKGFNKIGGVYARGKKEGEFYL